MAKQHEMNNNIFNNKINESLFNNTETNNLISLSSNEENTNHEKEENNINNNNNNNIKINSIKINVDIKTNFELNIIKNKVDKNCLICEEELTEEEIENNLIECYHGFCNTCLLEYLREKINNNEVINIKCPKYKCETILNDNFIKNHLNNVDSKLLNKYKKFKIRYIIFSSNKDLQVCPFPDCDSYAYKNSNNKYVTCYKGHPFCLKCLKPWHNNEICEAEEDENFKKWKKTREVERCPRCKYYIEKRGGCNIITCINCKYEWCWLCKKEYKPGHYGIGKKCEGLKYEKKPNDSCLNNKVLYYIRRAKTLFRFYLDFPYFFVLFISVKFMGKLIDKINSKSKYFHKCYAYTLLLIIFLLFFKLLFIGTIVLMIILFYWPFQRKVLNEYYDMV